MEAMNETRRSRIKNTLRHIHDLLVTGYLSEFEFRVFGTTSRNGHSR